MQVTINIPNEQLFEKIVWFLNAFKKDGLEIISSSSNHDREDIENKQLKDFENLLNIKSKNAVVLSSDTILNPHSELSNDIS
ncbi:MAG: Unknown protein [uncultured Sulfurovum sp.]|uniref:Uncharacterized protein n=1 Tax=uncultured Sulfurovum sp. TaxID=269237 RepID=A0A6S6S7B3_9BACT|nr:MAG: Unknown protein [uncultured Sulfurovum sp.]